MIQENLKPCPFCGSNEIDIKSNYYMSGQTNSLISVILRHWCKSGSRIEFRCKTKQEVFDMWNNRI